MHAAWWLLGACTKEPPALEDTDVLVHAWQDADGDGFGNAEYRIGVSTTPVGYVDNDDDCDDANAAVSPAADEVCNSVDDDCDGGIDEEPVAHTTWYLDADADGYGLDSVQVETCATPAGYAASGGDCDDANAAVNPAAAEACGDAIDDDCSGAAERCAPEGEYNLVDVPLKVLAAEPEQGLGDKIRFAEDCVGSGGVGLFLHTTGTEAGIPQTQVAFSGEPPTGGDLPAGGVVITGTASSTDWVGNAVTCASGVGSIGGQVLLVAGGQDHDDTWVVGFPAPLGATVSPSDATYFLTREDGEAGIANIEVADTTGDGIPELIGSTNATFSLDGVWAESLGRAYVVDISAGAEWALADAMATLTPAVDTGFASFGFSLCAVDLDGDGLTDIASGNTRDPADHYTDWLGAGVVWITYAPFAGDMIVSDRDGNLVDGDGLWMGETENDNAGSALTCKRDLTGDGLPDLLIGAYQNPTDAPGLAYVVEGPAAGVHSVSEAKVVIRAELPEQSFGIAVTGDSDLDGDGLGDLAIAGGGEEGSRGRVYLFYSGGLSGTIDASAADATWSGAADLDNASNVAGGGDLDGDGFDELAIGAPGESTNGEDAGAVYIVHGGWR